MEKNPLQSEKELLLQVAANNEAAFTTLFHQYWNHIYSVAFVFTKSEPMAEDVVQELFLKIWRTRHQLGTIENFENYLFILARNHIFSEFKKLKIRQDHVERLKTYFEGQAHTPEDQLLSKEVQALLERAIAALPAQQQQVYRLSRRHGYTHEEIAAQLGISVHTVRNHMIRAVKHIREFLIQQDSSLVVFATALYFF